MRIAVTVGADSIRLRAANSRPYIELRGATTERMSFFACKKAIERSVLRRRGGLLC